MPNFQFQHIENGILVSTSEPLYLLYLDEAYKMVGTAAAERASELATVEKSGLVVVRAVDAQGVERASAWMRWGQSERLSSAEADIIDLDTYWSIA